jgi:hypothetical protein
LKGCATGAGFKPTNSGSLIDQQWLGLLGLGPKVGQGANVMKLFMGVIQKFL